MTTLLRAPAPVAFDANNQEHRQAYIQFLMTNKWPMTFQIEWPFKSLPGMIMFKLAAKACENDGEIDLEAVLKKASSPVASAGNDESATLVKKAA